MQQIQHGIEVTAYALTDVGCVRTNNEDNFLIADPKSGCGWTAEAGNCARARLVLNPGEDELLCAVADGMGGAAAGEVAGRLAVSWVGFTAKESRSISGLRRFPFGERLRFAVEEANRRIADHAKSSDLEGMGATFTAAGIAGDKLVVAQVGDSRAYLLRNETLVRLTRDQSLVWQLVESNMISEEEAETHPRKNVILQALGVCDRLHVVIQETDLCRGDLVLLCSDGLSGKVKHDAMRDILGKEKSDLEQAARELIRAAKEAGGEDNITVVLISVMGDGLPATGGTPPGPPPEVERAADLPGRVS